MSAKDIIVGHLGLIELREADGSLAPASDSLDDPTRPGSAALIVFVRDVMDIHHKVEDAE